MFPCGKVDENHDVLDKLEADNPDNAFPEIAPYIHFAKFGSVLKLLDGTNVLFCGGAESADKMFRIEGKEWWPQEGIDDEDMSKLPSNESKIDWVISHAAPFSFDLGVYVTYSRPEKLNEASRYKLDEVLQIYKPKKWFFGHYHYSHSGQSLGCNWECSNYSHTNDKRSWISIREIIQI